MAAENEDNETTLRLRQLRGDTPGPEAARQEARTGPDTQKREAKEPAPADANPTSDPEGRPLDRRKSSP